MPVDDPDRLKKLTTALDLFQQQNLHERNQEEYRDDHDEYRHRASHTLALVIGCMIRPGLCQVFGSRQHQAST
jgi:hypothetical protein